MDVNSVSPLHGGPGRRILCFSWMTSSALSGTLESSSFGLSSALFLFFLSFSFLLLQIHVSLTDWRNKWRSKSVWLSRLRQSDCKEGTTSQALKPVPAFTLPANPRETCPRLALLWQEPDVKVTNWHTRHPSTLIMATLGMGKKSHLWLSRTRAGENAVKQGKEKDQGEVSWMAER